MDVKSSVPGEFSRDREEHPFRNICRMIADTLQILCHHKKIQLLLGIGSFHTDPFCDRRLYLQEMIIHIVSSCYHDLCVFIVLRLKCIYRLDQHDAGLFCHILDQTDLAGICLIAHQNGKLRNIRSMIAYTFHIREHLQCR